MKARRAVGAIILVDSFVTPTRFLAAKRSEPPALAGYWEFPGGKSEPGEPTDETARREAQEELGIDVQIGAQLCRAHPGHGAPGAGSPSAVAGKSLSDPHGADCSWPLGELHAMDVFFAVSRTGEPRIMEDHAELRWPSSAAPYLEAESLCWIPDDLPIVRAALVHLSAGASLEIDES